jgi:hypothetical protein
MQSPPTASLFLYAFVETEPIISRALFDQLQSATNRSEIRFLVALHMAALRVAIEEWLERGNNHDNRADLIALLSQNLDRLSSLPLEQK